MVTFKELTWSNAFSYGENNKFNFVDNKLTQLIGKNGHGKSSIFLLLEEVLFNKNSKNTKRAKILNRYSKAKAYSIGLTFDKDGQDYSITTTRGSTQTVKLMHNGVDISAHTSTGTYSLIEEIIGLDHKTFAQIVYQSDAFGLEFLVATDTARKRFLIDLLNLGMYTKAHEVFKDAASGLTKELDKLEASKDTITSWLAKFDPSKLVPLPIVEVPEPPSNLQAQLISLKSDLSNISSINSTRTKNNLYKEQIDVLGQAVALDTNDYSIVTQETLTPLEIRKSELDAIVTKETTYQTKHSGISHTCPTCKQNVDNSKTISMLAESKARLAEAKDELPALVTKIAAIKKALVKKKELETTKSSLEQYMSLYQENIPSELLEASTLESSIKTITKQIADINAAITKATQDNTKATAHNTKIDILTEQFAGMNKDLAEVNSVITEKTTKLTTLQVLVKTFSTTGLVAYKIECLVKDLEQLTNEYLAELCSGRFQISFQISTSDKLSVVITDNGNDIDITDLSRGERARVNVATLLAIRKLMQSLSNSRVNLLVLDETISNLDTEGKEKLVETLLAEENLNTVVVSHDFSHPLLDKVEVVKTNNISRIV